MKQYTQPVIKTYVQDETAFCVLNFSIPGENDTWGDGSGNNPEGNG